MDVAAGHRLLGMRCLKEILAMKEGDVSLTPYTTKYTMQHLVSAGEEASPLLDIGG